jgi:hypothetical protein
MDRNYYSDKTIREFVKKNICFGDAVLYKYYETNNIKKFRNRLSILKITQKEIEKNIYVYITDSFRDIILRFVGKLTVFTKPMGDLVISGGEAFNSYFDQGNRIVTSDIDTKFVPVMKVSNNKIVGPNYYKYFGFLQAIKLLIWNFLGQHCDEIGKKIMKRFELIRNEKFIKFLGIRLPVNAGPVVTRRYTLIRKMKQSPNSTTAITNGDVLIDVELFALDLKLKYFTPENGIAVHNLGGLLDIAIMRPNEVGHEVIYSYDSGIAYTNPVTKKVIFDKNVNISGKKFLVEDLYLMQSLGLRPSKKDKDKKRIIKFSRNVLKLNKVNSSLSMKKIFQMSLRSVSRLPDKDIKKRRVTNLNKIMKSASQVSPYRYEKYTTVPDKSKVYSQFMFGVKAPRNAVIPGFKPTSGIWRFDKNTGQWKKNLSNLYIKNEMNFRMNKKFVNTKHVLSNNSKVILYGYNPRRDHWVSKDLIKRSSLIPFIGLKN